jgi:hypothetical protein
MGFFPKVKMYYFEVKMIPRTRTPHPNLYETSYTRTSYIDSKKKKL